MASTWLSLALALAEFARSLARHFRGQSEHQNLRERLDIVAKARNHDQLLTALKARRKARKAYLDGGTYGGQSVSLPNSESGQDGDGD